MTVTYHAGRRIQGTQADFDGTPAISGGWKELGRTTLGSAGNNIDIASLPDKRYYMILSDITASGTTTGCVTRLNDDSGSNYAYRRQLDGVSDSTGTSQTGMIQHGLALGHLKWFEVSYLSNLATKEKLLVGHSMQRGSSGAGNAPQRQEWADKWANTSAAVNKISKVQTIGGANYASGSECVVLGWDPADTHTTNFWEELASVELGTTADSFDTGTFTAKKYLWVQVFTKGSGAVRAGVRLGNSTIDTGANYAIRRSHNGAADGTFTSGTFGVVSTSGATSNDNEFINMFIINNASNEKLAISHYNRKNTSGAANAPNRGEIVGKWANTSNQCNIIQVHNDQSGDFVSGSFIKVWGSN